MLRVLPFLLLTIMLSSLNGCVGASTRPFLWQDETVDLVWPPPPDEPRISYLRSLLGPQDFKAKDRTSGVLEWFLGERQNDLPLLSPFAVATSRSGLVWVADNGARMLYRLDLNRRKVDYFKEFAGIRLFSPSGVAVDEASRRVFLADAESPRVFVLDFEGNYLESWGPTGGFKRPAGLALDSTGRLYVADVMGKSVYVFNIDGSLAKKVQSRLSTDGRFKKPLNVAIGPNDEVLVLDAISFTVEVQDAQGELMATIGQPGNAAGYFARPKGLAVDREGHVFVSDSAFDNIQVFDLAGNLLMFFGETGGQFGQFNLVSGLFVDEEDRLFVADSYNHRIQAFKLLH